MIREFLNSSVPVRRVAIGLMVVTLVLLGILLKLGIIDGVDRFILALPLAMMNLFGYITLTTPVVKDYTDVVRYRHRFWRSSLVIWCFFLSFFFVGPFVGRPVTREQVVLVLVGFAFCQLMRIVFRNKPKRWHYASGFSNMLVSGFLLYYVLVGLI